MNEEFRIICDGDSLRIYKGNYGFNFEEIVELLNEQQTTIKKLQDLCGQSDSENAKLRLQNKTMKEEMDYWKNKTMILLMQMRTLTSRMTESEIKKFNKELEDD